MDLELRVTGMKEVMFTQVRALLDGGKTLCPALVYIDGDVSSTELIYLEIAMCGLTLELGE